VGVQYLLVCGTEIIPDVSEELRFKKLKKNSTKLPAHLYVTTWDAQTTRSCAFARSIQTCLPTIEDLTWASSLSSRSMTTKLDLLSMSTYGTTSHPVHGHAPRCPRMQASR
jgi:hypothetical protein